MMVTIVAFPSEARGGLKPPFPAISAIAPISPWLR